MARNWATIGEERSSVAQAISCQRPSDATPNGNPMHLREGARSYLLHKAYHRISRGLRAFGYEASSAVTMDFASASVATFDPSNTARP
jgi:hypothetical protein